ncbi:MAG: tRNA (adenosine(37)-N6)-threonylcarbamoyltransferase complex ATPase subunit type 1 TsaE [Pedosphaera parvula]|nr:tRNA (adenosine(37)-N6)-threonylcarbamoyltransferase complex ATPase subunit type 1 TsaE [Pedosphaera parvula]
MVTFISNSVEETAALGERWGREAVPGLVIGLTGDLGAGKTQLVKGIARGLGIAGRVLSPTFALVHEYRGGRLALFHLDLYRLETRAQILGAGLEEYLNPTGVTVVEWADRCFNPDGLAREGNFHLPLCYRHVSLVAEGETCRRINYEDFGA